MRPYRPAGFRGTVMAGGVLVSRGRGLVVVFMAVCGGMAAAVCFWVTRDQEVGPWYDAVAGSPDGASIAWTRCEERENPEPALKEYRILVCTLEVEKAEQVVAEPTPRPRANVRGTGYQIAWAPGGEYLTVYNDIRFSIFSTETLQTVPPYFPDGAIQRFLGWWDGSAFLMNQKDAACPIQLFRIGASTPTCPPELHVAWNSALRRFAFEGEDVLVGAMTMSPDRSAFIATIWDDEYDPWAELGYSDDEKKLLAGLGFHPNLREFLVRVPVDGSQPVPLTDPLGYAAGPVWSPDGARIAYYSSEGLMVMTADGGNVRKLTDYPRRLIPPLWSPDGSQILFSCSNLTLCAVPADGSQAYRNVTPDDRSYVDGTTYSWGPNGSVLYACREEGNAHRTFVCSARQDGTVEVRR